jgi:hypothetical protein
MHMQTLPLPGSLASRPSSSFNKVEPGCAHVEVSVESCVRRSRVLDMFRQPTDTMTAGARLRITQMLEHAHLIVEQEY